MAGAGPKLGRLGRRRPDIVVRKALAATKLAVGACPAELFSLWAWITITSLACLSPLSGVRRAVHLDLLARAGGARANSPLGAVAIVAS